ncbi:hypothetical protein DVH24_035960 [Malus domestica]|uniref:DUF8040 domain-containing protein n=1 Tax=Malus domestica TaxID=3750 RepID=A0A498JUT3_MALDO|nr:hypothetical protein DVH24_035960 [Malus domestica]
MSHFMTHYYKTRKKEEIMIRYFVTNIELSGHLIPNLEQNMDRRKLLLILLLEMPYLETICICTILVLLMLRAKQRHVERRTLTNLPLVRGELSLCYLNGIIGNTDIECVNELRMDRRTFGILCDLLRQDGRVKTDGLVSVEEQVCMTLQILAHQLCKLGLVLFVNYKILIRFFFFFS